MSEYGYRVTYDQLAEGGFQVIVPALPGYLRTDDRRGAKRDAGSAITRWSCRSMNLIRGLSSSPACRRWIPSRYVQRQYFLHESALVETLE